MSDRDEYIAGLRQFADWLENNPAVADPGRQQLLLPLMTNAAVDAFATEHGLTVSTDAVGNMSVEIQFGPITYRAYGYIDFAQHVADREEQQARRWAEKKGLELRKAGEAS
ncbi:hypothetical protein [Streptomyces sp. NPDC057557]|uniref:hypothetical protein n=1 Tax=Streptomyces sp. NPDC057557 TaxID=3346167 RepID=UPI00367B64E0